MKLSFEIICSITQVPTILDLYTRSNNKKLLEISYRGMLLHEFQLY